MAQPGQPHRHMPGSTPGIKDPHWLISQCRHILVQHAPEDGDPDGALGGAVDVGLELVCDPIKADITQCASLHVPHCPRSTIRLAQN